MTQTTESTNRNPPLANLAKLLHVFREADEIEPLVATTLSYFKATFDYSLIWIGLYDRKKHCLVGKGGKAPGKDMSFLTRSLSLTAGDRLEEVLIQMRPLTVPDLGAEARAGEWARMAKQWQVQGSLILPIRQKDLCLGLMILGASHWGITLREGDKAQFDIVLGELGAAIHRVMLSQHQLRSPAQPINELWPKLLQQTQDSQDLNQRLAAIVETVHRHLTPTRTEIHWYDPLLQVFQLRLGYPAKRTTRLSSEGQVEGLEATAVWNFYEALKANRLVAIGDAYSPFKADLTARLLREFQARSLLAAPILDRGELRGFLLVKTTEARIWDEAEKTCVQGVTNLIALLSPLETIEATLQTIRSDQLLLAGIARAIYSERDWRKSLAQTAEQLCKRLQAERFALLEADAETGEFSIAYQHHAKSRRPLPPVLPSLSEVDWKMLEQGETPVAIENLTADLRLFTWRPDLQEVDLNSLLVCNTAPGQSLAGVALVARERPSTWSQADRELLQSAAQQLGVISQQFRLQQQTEQMEKHYQALDRGLAEIRQAGQITTLEQTAVHNIAQSLNVPLVVLVTWAPSDQVARIAAIAVQNKNFAIHQDSVILLYQDALVQWLLQSETCLPLQVDDLPPESRQWLSAAGIGQLLGTALRTAAGHEPTGIVVIADGPDRFWRDRDQHALLTLANQLAWSRRALVLIDVFQAQRSALQQLNWYKNRQLEEFYKMVGAATQRLQRLLEQGKIPADLHLEQTLRQFGIAINSMLPLLRHEQWQLQTSEGAASLATLLRRAMDRIDSLVKKRQLWPQVHNLDSRVKVAGDMVKLESIFYEVLAAACRRSPTQGRLDIWCQPIDDQFLEIAITDNGVIEPALLAELQHGRSLDLLAPSAIDRLPGLILAICQALIQQLSGNLTFYALEDGRTLSRLVVPLADPDQVTTLLK
ncbi:GAF domain-containing protein [Trichothermofontia sp.]